MGVLNLGCMADVMGPWGSSAWSQSLTMGNLSGLSVGSISTTTLKRMM